MIDKNLHIPIEDIHGMNITTKLSGALYMSAAFLRQNQTPEERIKQQKREWYYRNRKSVLKQQKKSKNRKESKKE